MLGPTMVDAAGQPVTLFSGLVVSTRGLGF